VSVVVLPFTIDNLQKERNYVNENESFAFVDVWYLCSGKSGSIVFDDSKQPRGGGYTNVCHVRIYAITVDWYSNFYDHA
jgi:hypothetical protein